jgi:hypothetical protein
MTLKITPVAGEREIRICLSGQLRSEQIDQLKSEVERGGPSVTLDLEELDLVDIEGVRFLNACESAGVSIVNCSAYIREWMVQERSRPKEG